MKNNIKRNRGIWIMIGLMIGLILYYFITDYIHSKSALSKVCSQTTCFTVEIADSPLEREKGLMYRESLPEKKGMLFVFPTSDIHDFWMKNTIIPLDMIWIDNQFKVVHIANAQPCTEDPCKIYAPRTLAKYVLEINSGLTKKYNITGGTTLQFRNIK